MLQDTIFKNIMMQLSHVMLCVGELACIIVTVQFIITEYYIKYNQIRANIFRELYYLLYDIIMQQRQSKFTVKK